MRVAVAGKGGAGKTTISATMARTWARDAKHVLAIDGDPNPNLGIALGIGGDALAAAKRVPRDCVVDVYDDDGRQHMQLKMPLADLRREYATLAPDGVELLQVQSVGHAGEG